VSGLETPAELLAKARASRESLSIEEIDLIVDRFNLDGFTPGTSRDPKWLQVPGNSQAQALVADQEGIDRDFINRLIEYSMRDERVRAKRIARSLQRTPSMTQPPPMPSVPYATALSFSRDAVGADGKPSWPPLFRNFPSLYPETPPDVFALDVKEKESLDFAPIGADLYRLWDKLSQEEKASYEARSEVLRQAAWDEWDERQKKGLRAFGP
jgi:hypothetical protein